MVDVADKFGSSKVGHFVMFMIAWKIIGHQALAIFLGIPLWIAGAVFWWAVMRKLFFDRQVLASFDTATKVKTFTTVKYKWDSGDAKATAGAFAVVIIVAWNIMWIATVFWVY